MTEAVDLETGEIIDDEEAAEALGLERLILSRADADLQEKAWKRRKAILDAVILRKMEGPRVIVGDVLAKVADRASVKTDSIEFSIALEAAEAPRGVLLGVISSASGFRDAELPADAREPFEHASVRGRTNPWLETSPVLRRAPAEAGKGSRS